MTEEQPAHRGLSWTGERAVPWGDDLQVIYEHYHRYLLAALWVEGKDVLDLGSGEGYGADLLARTARSVVGVDIAADAVEHASVRYGRESVGFVVGSITDASSVEPEAYDVVVCFEALEHVEEHKDLIAVVRKALRPGGLFVTSTPERMAYNEDRSGGGNPYHVRELARDEFNDLLTGSFENVAMFEQQIAIGSLVTGMSAGQPQTVALLRDRDGWVGVPLPPATYLLGVASDGALPPVPSVSVLLDPQIELVRTAQRERFDTLDELRVAQQRLVEAEARADRRTADAHANADALRLELTELHRELQSVRTQAGDATQRALDLRRRVDHLEGSWAYRAYRGVRAGYTTFRTGP